MKWLPWVAGAATLIVARIALGKKRRTAPILREAALDVALVEDRKWGDEAPPTWRVDEYLAGVKPHGAQLVVANTDTNRINFCAAALGWTEHQTGLTDLPPWRSGAKQIMIDTQDGSRGNATWHPRSEVSRGWRPPVGAIAVYDRGGWRGHVDRVVSVPDDNVYECIGANEEGRRWTVELSSFWSEALLGFVVDGEEAADEGLRIRFPSPWDDIPVDYVEPLMTEEERRSIRGFG